LSGVEWQLSSRSPWKVDAKSSVYSRMRDQRNGDAEGESPYL
jgi:hypothetical protein